MSSELLIFCYTIFRKKTPENNPCRILLFNFRMALSAITRIDLSDNNISELPENIFQLTSLKSLNLNQNHLKELQFPRNEFTSPYLETFSAEGNELEVLSGQVRLSHRPHYCHQWIFIFNLCKFFSFSIPKVFPG